MSTLLCWAGTVFFRGALSIHERFGREEKGSVGSLPSILLRGPLPQVNCVLFADLITVSSVHPRDLFHIYSVMVKKKKEKKAFKPNPVKYRAKCKGLPFLQKLTFPLLFCAFEYMNLACGLPR